MIYDCFLFSDEAMLLEIRLHTLCDVVDKFVLVESTHTFSGENKELVYDKIKNQPPFLPFRDRIVHIVHDSKPSNDRWLNQTDQRNAIALGLRQAGEKDLILISDVDEIPNPAVFQLIEQQQEPTRFIQKLYYYYFNCQCDKNWYKAFFCRYRDLTSANSMRHDRELIRAIQNGGWHFSYLMTPEHIADKIGRLSQSEYDTDYFKNVERITKCVKEKLDLFDRINLQYRKVDLDVPAFIRQNLEKYSRFIL